MATWVLDLTGRGNEWLDVVEPLFYPGMEHDSFHLLHGNLREIENSFSHLLTVKPKGVNRVVLLLDTYESKGDILNQSLSARAIVALHTVTSLVGSILHQEVSESRIIILALDAQHRSTNGVTGKMDCREAVSCQLDCDGFASLSPDYPTWLFHKGDFNLPEDGWPFSRTHGLPVNVLPSFLEVDEKTRLYAQIEVLKMSFAELKASKCTAYESSRSAGTKDSDNQIYWEIMTQIFEDFYAFLESLSQKEIHQGYGQLHPNEKLQAMVRQSLSLKRFQDRCMLMVLPFPDANRMSLQSTLKPKLELAVLLRCIHDGALDDCLQNWQHPSVTAWHQGISLEVELTPDFSNPFQCFIAESTAGLANIRYAIDQKLAGTIMQWQDSACVYDDDSKVCTAISEKYLTGLFSVPDELKSYCDWTQREIALIEYSQNKHTDALQAFYRIIQETSAASTEIICNDLDEERGKREREYVSSMQKLKIPEPLNLPDFQSMVEQSADAYRLASQKKPVARQAAIAFLTGGLMLASAYSVGTTTIPVTSGINPALIDFLQFVLPLLLLIAVVLCFVLILQRYRKQLLTIAQSFEDQISSALSRIETDYSAKRQMIEQLCLIGIARKNFESVREEWQKASLKRSMLTYHFNVLEKHRQYAHDLIALLIDGKVISSGAVQPRNLLEYLPEQRNDIYVLHHGNISDHVVIQHGKQVPTQQNSPWVRINLN